MAEPRDPARQAAETLIAGELPGCDARSTEAVAAVIRSAYAPTIDIAELAIRGAAACRDHFLAQEVRVKELEEALRKAAAGFEELHANMPCQGCPTVDTYDDEVSGPRDRCSDLELVRAALGAKP